MYLQLTPVQSARINRDGGDVHSTTAQAGAVFPLRYAQSERGVGSPPKGDEAGSGRQYRQRCRPSGR